MTFIQFCMKVGPPTLLMALISLPFFYKRGRSVAQAETRPSLAKFCFVVFVCGGLAFAAGTALGISLACGAQTAANLCGLAGFLGLGPLFCGLVMMLTAWLYTRGTRQARR